MNSVPIGRGTALALLRLNALRPGVDLMSKEYGTDDCSLCAEEAEERDEPLDWSAECPHWSAVYPDDLETLEHDPTYRRFELWATGEVPA